MSKSVSTVEPLSRVSLLNKVNVCTKLEAAPPSPSTSSTASAASPLPRQATHITASRVVSKLIHVHVPPLRVHTHRGASVYTWLLHTKCTNRARSPLLLTISALDKQAVHRASAVRVCSFVRCATWPHERTPHTDTQDVRFERKWV